MISLSRLPLEGMETDQREAQFRADLMNALEGLGRTFEDDTGDEEYLERKHHLYNPDDEWEQEEADCYYWGES